MTTQLQLINIISLEACQGRARFQQNRDASFQQVFSPLQGKAPKEIHTILTETLASFLPGRAKDLLAPCMYRESCRILLHLSNKCTIYIYIYISHHKHQWLDPMIRSVSTVAAARANASTVFQLFSFLVVCSGMISRGFGFVVFFASVKASSVCIHLSCLVCL